MINIRRTPNYEEKILSLPISSYHFISYIFSDTVLVGKAAVIRLLRDYPLRQEVKGITQRLVNFVLNSETLDVPETAIAPADSTAEDQPHNWKPAVHVPASLWEGRSPEAICKAMKDNGFGDHIIAYVLFAKCKKKKTYIVAP